MGIVTEVVEIRSSVEITRRRRYQECRALQ